MARLSRKLVELERALIVAKRKEEYIQQELQRQIDNQIVTPYTPRGAMVTYWVQSYVEPDLLVEVSVPQESFNTCFGSADAAAITKLGGVETLPITGGIAEQRGFAHMYLSIKFTHLDPTPQAKLTPWGTRVIKRYQEVGDQAFRQFPMGGDYKEVRAKFVTITGSPAPFSKGKIELLSGTNKVLASVTVK